MATSHTSALPIPLQLGGALKTHRVAEWWYPNASGGVLDVVKHLGHVLLIDNDDSHQRARPERSRRQSSPCSTSRRMLGSARAKCRRTRALHRKWCAPTSIPSVDCAWAVAPPNFVPVRLGVTIPQNPIGRLSEALSRHPCTDCTGRATTVWPRKGGLSEPPGWAEGPGRAARAF